MSLVDELRAVIHGDVILPTDALYVDRAWTTNLDHAHVPQVLVSCKDYEDVKNCVILGKKHGVKVAAKSGGHGWLNFSIPQGGLCVELNTYLNHIDIETAPVPLAKVQSGTFLGTLYSAADSHGLAAVGGWCSGVGVGGLFPGGGWSLLSRKHGLPCDTVISADIVIADGSLITATPHNEHKELFKGLRGGGLNNFGVIVSLTLLLFPITPQIAYAFYNFSFSKTEEVFTFFSDFYIKDAPSSPDLTFYASVNSAYDADHNTRTNSVSLMALYAGNPTVGKEVLTHLAEKLKPDSFTVTIDTYPNFIAYAGGPIRPKNPDGSYQKTYLWTEQGYLGGPITHEIIKAIISAFETVPFANGLSYGFGFDGFGGKVWEEPPGGSSVAHRKSKFLYGMLINSSYTPISEEVKKWARELGIVVANHGVPGKFVNLRILDHANTQLEYYGEHLPFLRALKQKYDLTDLFGYPQGLDSNSIQLGSGHYTQ